MPASLSADLPQAERPGAAGRHDEATNSLARAAKARDVEGTTRIVKRLLSTIGQLICRGMPHVSWSKLHGLAEEAAALPAVIAEAAACIRRSWKDGLRALVLAAERRRGSRPDALRILARDRELAAVAPSS